MWYHSIFHPCRSGLPSSCHHPLTLECEVFPCHPAGRHRNPKSRMSQVHRHNPRHREPRSQPSDHISSCPLGVPTVASSCRHSPRDIFQPKAPTHGAQDISCLDCQAAVRGRNRFRARYMRMFHRHLKIQRSRQPRCPLVCYRPKRLHSWCPWGQSLLNSHGCLFRRNGSRCRRHQYFSKAMDHHQHRPYSCLWDALQC